MKIEKASSTSGEQTWQINEPVATPQGETYQKVIQLDFSTGGHADSIKINRAGSLISGRFLSYTYDAISTSSPTHHGSDKSTLIFTLDRLSRIHRIKYSTTSARAKKKTAKKKSHAVHRSVSAAAVNDSAPVATIDVAADHDDVTVTGAQASAQAQFVTESIELYRVDGEAVADEQTATVANNSIITDFIADRFAIRVKRYDTLVEDLKSSYIQNLIILSNPTGPRIGLADPPGEGQPLEVDTFFWHIPGEIFDSAATIPEDKDPTDELVNTLQRHLDDKISTFRENNPGVQLPATISVDLVIASDAICSFEASNLYVDYSILRQETIFTSDQTSLDKQVMRFDGTQVNTNEFTLYLPANAVITNALLEATASFGGEAAYPVGMDIPAVSGLSRDGVSIDHETWAGQPFKPEQAVNINGLALAVMATENDCELMIEIQEDWNDAPSGKAIATGNISLEQSGTRTWSRISFPSTLLATVTYWILLKSTKGTAIWFTQANGASSVRRLHASSGGTPASEINQINNIETMYILFSPQQQIDTNNIPFVVQGSSVEGSFVSRDEDRFIFNITDTLNNMLAGMAGSDLVPVKLSVNSVFGGLITVYAPTIEYDLLI